ncbi:MAG: enhanced intracellular survival protein Eis [Candidatus Hermodarchaeota archaeon]
MEIRKLTENDRDACRKLMRYAFQTLKNSYENLEFPQDSLPMDWYYGAFVEEELYACIGVTPFDIKLRSQDFKMGGVMGVATKPEYRNRGIVRDLMVRWFKEMYKNNIPISVLYPFKFSFYEMLGYRLVDESVLYHFKISDIKYKETNYVMNEVERINEDFQKVYDKAILNFDYIAKRPMIENWRRLFKENYKFICYRGNQPVGYLIISFIQRSLDRYDWFKHPERTILIREAFWLDNIAKQTIFNFLWSHRDQRRYIAGFFPPNENIIDLLKTPRIKERFIIGNSMLRVINVKTVLDNLKYPKATFSILFQIHDDFCPWNNGYFNLNSNETKIEVEYNESSSEKVDLEIDISYFSQLIAGFRTVRDLLEFGFISVNEEKLKLLEVLFPKTNNFFFDFF